MAFKALSAVGKLGALLVALPNVGLIVLPVFMSLPVILAAEFFIAAIRGAAVWSLMALHMLPVGRSVYAGLNRHWPERRHTSDRIAEETACGTLGRSGAFVTLM